MLGVPCAFATASDGQTRCLPGSGQVFQVPTGSSPTFAGALLVYADAACTTSVLVTGSGALGGSCQGVEQHAYGQIPTNNSSCAGTVVFSITGTTTTPATVWTLNEDVQDAGVSFSCQPITIAPGGQSYLVTVVDPTTLVSASIQ
jgi:hypothetical protein